MATKYSIFFGILLTAVCFFNGGKGCFLEVMRLTPRQHAFCRSIAAAGPLTFFLIKKSAKTDRRELMDTKNRHLSINQGIECSPKLGFRFLKSKTGTKWSSAQLNSFPSNSFDFFTYSQPQFLTATHPKADCIADVAYLVRVILKGHVLRSKNTVPIISVLPIEGLLFSDGEAERYRSANQIGSEIFVMKDTSSQKFGSRVEVSVFGAVGQIASKVDKQLGYLPAMQVTRLSAGEDGKVCAMGKESSIPVCCVCGKRAIA